MTELIWDGKYATDSRGNRVKAAPLRIALPFQTVETINESAQDRQKALDMFSDGDDPEWRIWTSHLPEFYQISALCASRRRAIRFSLWVASDSKY